MSGLLLRILLFLLPFLLFALWYFGRRRAKAGGPVPALERQIVIGLWGLVALVLIVAAITVFTRPSGDRGDRYIPPHVEDGEVVPGRFVDEDEP